jgi:predicted glycoside hydrolase/deacetylase ChbG (UPF0249 family)
MTSDQRRLVVNADDFGLSPGVNRGVIESHRRGIVTSASLMANLPAAEEALALWHQADSMGLGMHLNLTAGPPVCSVEQVPSLVRPDGRFWVLGELLRRLTSGAARAAELERELHAQVERALAGGARLDHLDSHHHVHIHPRLARLVIRLAKYYGIPAVRAPSEGFIPLRYQRPRPRDAARVLAISVCGWAFGRLAQRSGLRTAEHFRGIAMGTGFALPTLLRELTRLPGGLTELMVHPGYVDAELRQWTSFREGRDSELAALTALAARAVVQRSRVQLRRWDEAVTP